ncbi:MAG TPA: hypothetical protein VEL28_22670 [Candidatus Binatia bacterium]|nr:hypothetical protein [Candidatus Binatia bacterium]
MDREFPATCISAKFLRRRYAVIIRLAAAIAASVLLAAAVVHEVKAMRCGDSWFRFTLPHDLKIDRLSGVVYIADPDDVWVVYGNDERLVNGTLLRIKQIQAYAVRDNTLLVQVLLDSGETAVVALHGSGPDDLELVSASTVLDDSGVSWVRVDPESCYHGAFEHRRLQLVVGILAALMVVYCSRPSRAE